MEAILVFVVAAATALAILVLPAPRPLDDAAWAFLGAPRTLPWLAVLTIQIAIWALLLGPSLTGVRSLWEYRWAGRTRILFTAIFVFVLATLPSLAPFVLGGLPSVIPGHSTKMGILTITGVLLALPSIIGILLVDATISQEHAQVNGSEEEVKAFLQLRAQLLRFRSILGAFIGIAMLASGALRNALSALPGTEVGPIELVWLYGAYFTLLFALLYVPTYVRLLGAGQRLRNTLGSSARESGAAEPQTRLELLARQHESRKQAGEILHLNVTTAETVRSGIILFAPLISAFVSTLVGLEI